LAFLGVGLLGELAFWGVGLLGSWPFLGVGLFWELGVIAARSVSE
jgi:hypothetical protein